MIWNDFMVKTQQSKKWSYLDKQNHMLRKYEICKTVIQRFLCSPSWLIVHHFPMVVSHIHGPFELLKAQAGMLHCKDNNFFYFS